MDLGQAVAIDRVRVERAAAARVLNVMVRRPQPRERAVREPNRREADEVARAIALNDEAAWYRAHHGVKCRWIVGRKRARRAVRCEEQEMVLIATRAIDSDDHRPVVERRRSDAVPSC